VATFQRSRTEATHSKWRKLTPAQSKALLRWLRVEKLTYESARARLQEKFAISISISALSRWWHRHCAPVAAPSNVLLDVVVKARGRVRLIVKRKADGIRVLHQKGEK
jgi:hypothetical protein